MEDITKETGHRASVSMPSLDSTDDFPAASNEETTDSSVFKTNSFVSASSTVSITSQIALENINEETPSTSLDKTTNESIEESSFLNESTESETGIDETLVQENINAPELISANASETLIDTQPEGLDESQGDEDPSIAIDQFIKKIADEQLSSKRIEERKEEEAQEHVNEPVEASLDESMLTSTDAQLESAPVGVLDTAQEEPDKQPEEKSSKDKEIEKNSEPMEVDINETLESEKKILEKALAAAVGDEDEHMAESIEEIQKEINKIPPNKMATSDDSKNIKEEAAVTNNGVEQAEDQIEEILGGDPDKNNVGNILKSALEKQHRLPTIEDSAEVAKDPHLIEKAQEEISKLDILVCGECHNTFYYTQEFTEHKKGKCTKVSSLSNSCESENKPQVWGYCLWKSKYIKNSKDSNQSAWAIYQCWCNLPQADKSAWITAGQSIQFASRISNAKVMEMRPTKTAKQSTVQKITGANPPPLEFIDSNKENATFSIDSSGNLVKKGFNKPLKLNDVTIVPTSKIASASSNNSMSNSANTAVRSTKNTSIQKDEFVVEKIMAKRFNPRRKTWEYNIKWENFGHDSNTWEPISNLSHCKKLLEQFEEQLKRMKEDKAKIAAQSPKNRGRPSKEPKLSTSSSNFVPIAPKISNVVGGVSDDYGSSTSNRPTRSCKQKAMDQVKQWCGSISDDESDLKRKYNFDDDSDEDFDAKKIKLEADSEDSDAGGKQKVLTKKVTSTPKLIAPAKPITVKNGNTTQQILPSNILIPDANGVVRINQKQLPALSSGVYIMSKTAGIIKLDSTTSKVATSGGQTIVKVAPKIGQTQIKIVKKDGNTTKQIIQVAPKKSTNSTPVRIAPAAVKVSSTPKFNPKLRKEVKKIVAPSEVKVDEEALKKPTIDDDSDDGLEPLPFPDPDEPIPEIEEEEKNDDFILDPETGKIAGVEYVDKPVVIKKEPQPQPLPTTNELENIVKIAAADLSDEDFHNNTSESQDESFFEIKKEEPKPFVKKPPEKIEKTVIDTSTPGIRKIVKYTVTSSASSTKNQNPTVLNKNVVQTKSKQISTGIRPQGAPQNRQFGQQQQQQQKVINQMVSQRQPAQQVKTVVRHVIEPSRPTMVRKTIGPATNKPKFNLAPQKPMGSPLQPTRTYSAMGGIRQSTVGAGVGNKVQVYSAKSSNVPAGQTTTIRRVGNTLVRSTSTGIIRQQQPQQSMVQKQPVTRIVQRVVTSPTKKPAAPQQQQQQLNKNVTPIQNAPAAVPVKSKNVINMPSLTEDDMPLSSSPKPQPKPAASVTQQKPAALAQTKVAPARPAVKQEPVLKVEEPSADESSQLETLDAAANNEQTDWSSFTMADGDNPIYVTGDDGTIYQVAGQNEQGQTILITQGPDGQQQCLLVTNEIGEMTGDEPQPSTSTANLTAEAEAAAGSEAGVEPVKVAEAAIATSVDESLQTPLQIKTDAVELEGIEDGMQDQVVAQVVRAEPPSPGGTHKVVVMLPDGNLMVTQVSPEEYASLELE